jgi:PAS domain S-box-containing protein
VATPPAADPAPADLGLGPLFWHLRDAVVVGDATTGRIVLWNPAAEALFGYAADEAIGLPIDVLVPDALKPRHHAGLAQYRQTGHGRLIDGATPVELPARRKTGEEIWVELTLSPVERDGSVGRLVMAMVRDVTSRKQAEAEHLERLRADAERADAEQRARLAAFGADIGRAVTNSHTLAEALQRTTEALVRHLDAAFARIWILNEPQQVLELQASAGLYTHLDGGHSRVPVGHYKIGLIAQERRPHLTNDVLNDPRVSDKAWARREGMVAFAGYPLLVEQHVVGVVAVFARHALDQHALDELAGVMETLAQYIERKRAQEALQQREARFRALIEHAHDIITILAEDGIIRYESPAIERVLGFSPAELVGKNGFDFVHPDDRPAVRQTFLQLVGRPGATVPTLFRFRHADGSWRWLEAVGFNLLADPAVAGVVVNSRDVTERRQSDEALRRSEERFRKLIEHSSDVITLTEPDGRLSYASPSTTWVLGYQPAELVGGHALVRVHPEDRDLVGRALAQVQEQAGKIVVARYRTRHADGSWRWVETTLTNLLDEPAVGAIVANRRDVSAEAEAQQALEQRVADRTRELATLLDVSRGMASTLELPQLIGFIFDQLKTIFDYSAVGLHLAVEGDEYRTLDYRGPLPRERMLANRNSPAIVALLKEAGETGRPVLLDDFGGDTPVMRRFETEGVPLPPEAYGHARAVLIAPLLLGGRHLGGLTLMHRLPGYYTAEHAEYVMAFAQQAAIAIENARLYEAVRDKAALEERQRLARELHDSVSQALYAIALNSAAAGESLRKRDAPRTARLVKHVRQLARAGLAEMRALIFELRAESLAEEGLVAALAKQAAAVEARHELKVRTQLGSEPAVPLATKEALYRIAQEALHNTVKHAQARTAEISLAADRAGLVLTVRDHGRGFAVDDAFPGHLGLRSMRERAEALGGTLTLQSAPRCGTTVRVELPVTRQLQAEAAVEGPGPAASGLP